MTSRAKPKRSGAPKSGREPIALGVLNEHLGYFVRRLQIDIFKDFIRALARIDVRPAQYSVLVLISRNPGRSQAEIGRALDIERAALAKMLHLLQRRGWVERRANDGRSHSLFLTRRGESALTRATALAAGHEEHLTRRLGEERHRQLLALLRDFG